MTLSSSPSVIISPSSPEKALLDIISCASQEGSSPAHIISHALNGGLLNCIYLRRSSPASSTNDGKAATPPPAALVRGKEGEGSDDPTSDQVNHNGSFHHLQVDSSLSSLPSPSLSRCPFYNFLSEHCHEEGECVFLPTSKAISMISSLVNQGYFSPSLPLVVKAGKKGFHYRSAAFLKEAFVMLVLLFADCFIHLPDQLQSLLESEVSQELPCCSSFQFQLSNRSPSSEDRLPVDQDCSSETNGASDPEVSISSDMGVKNKIKFLCDERAAMMTRDEVALAYLISINNMLYHIQIQEFEIQARARSDSQKGGTAGRSSAKYHRSSQCSPDPVSIPAGSATPLHSPPDEISVEESNLSFLASELERLKVIVILCLCASSLWVKELETDKKKHVNHFGNRISHENCADFDNGYPHHKCMQGLPAQDRGLSNSNSCYFSSLFPPSFFEQVSEGQFFRAYESQERPPTRKRQDKWFDEMVQKIRLAYHDAHSVEDESPGFRARSAFPSTIESYLERIHSRAKLEGRKLSIIPEMLLYPSFGERPSVVLTHIKPPIPSQPHMPLLPGEMSFLLSTSVLEIDSCEHPLSLFLHNCTTRRLRINELRDQIAFVDEITRTSLPPRSFMILSAFSDNTDNVFNFVEKNPEVLSHMVLSFASIEDYDEIEYRMSATSPSSDTYLEDIDTKEHHLAMKIVHTVLFDRPFSVSVGKFLRKLITHEFLEEELIIAWLDHCCTAAEVSPSFFPRKSTLSRSFFAVVNFALTRLECKLEPTLSQRFNKIRVDAA